MRIESRVRRNKLLFASLQIVPEVLLAAGISSYLDWGMTGFWFLLPALFLLYVVIWLKNTLWAWTIFFLGGRQTASKSIAAFMSEKRFPEPEEYEISPDGYLSRIMEDEKTPLELRLLASSSLSEIVTLSTLGYLQAGLRVRLIYEDALLAYKATFPRVSREI